MKKQNKKSSLFGKVKRVPAMVAIAILVVGGTSAGIAHASIQSQIDALNQENAKDQSAVSSLQIQANSYQDAINKLQAQIDSYQSAINANEAKQASIQAQINAEQKELDTQKSYLADDLKAMYVDGDMSTVEMLASSKDLSDFVDAETYRGAVQTKIQNTMASITKLQNQLEDAKTQVQNLLNQQQAQQQQLASDQSQKNQLLSMNQDEQASYNNKIKSNNNEIAKLQAEQVALNRQIGSGYMTGGSGGYPYANAICAIAGGGPSCGNYDWSINGNEYDPEGWGYRNCTSYAFWRLAQARGIVLGAGSFPHVAAGTDENGTFYGPQGGIGFSIPDFRNLGYTVDHNPANSMLAVEGAGPYGPGTYGHIMYVESSNSSSAYVSQYNYAGTGEYSTMTLYPSSGIWFVHP